MTAHAHRSNATRASIASIRSLLAAHFLFTAGFLLAVLLVMAPSDASALEAGDRAPDFAAPALDGKGTVSLSQYRGKVVYLD